MIRNFDEQNFDELIVAFIGIVLTGKKTLTNRSPFVKVRHTFPLSKFCAIRYCVATLYIYA